jgi:hypothetical protein
MKGEGLLCGGQRRHGAGICHRPAGAGTSHRGRGRCSWHGGTSPTHEAHDRRVLAEEACAQLGIPVRTTAVRALRDELARVNGVLGFLYAQCAALTAAEMTSGEWQRTTATGTDGETRQTVVTRAGVNVWMRLLEHWSQRLTEIAAAMARLDIDRQAAEAGRELGGRAVSALERALDGAGITGAPRLRVLQLLAAGDDG